MSQVTFVIDNDKEVKIDVTDGVSLLEAARSANVAIDAPCSGNVSCGKCMVMLLEGEPESRITQHISEEDYKQGYRLACNSFVKGDVRVSVPDIALAYQSRMKTADLSSPEEVAIFKKLEDALKATGIAFGGVVDVRPLRVDEPTLDDTMPDVERIERALGDMPDIDSVDISFTAMKKMAHILRESCFSVKCVGLLEDGRYTLLDMLAADETKNPCGIAIDIGTTTVSAVLIDLVSGDILSKASSGNGQIRYGADVINRIIEQSKEGGRAKLQKAIIKDTLVPVITTLCADSGIPAPMVYRMSICANTTMNHLLVGAYSDPVRMEPYIPTFFAFKGIKASDLDFPVHPDARVLMGPNIGSYVGGDITAGALASLIWDKDEFSLFIDLGTNGEIVFGNRDFMMACACSAGPAFEGGDISCGMRATDGAIEAVEIDDNDEPKLSIIGDPGQKPVGLCGSGIIDVIAEMFKAGIISAKGEFKKDCPRVKKDEHGMGRFVLAEASESATDREIAITEVDIESFIRAKGAIFSAIDTMLSSIDMDVSVLEHVYVAGGIGSGINMRNAVIIGMFPDIEQDKYEYIGNSSLTGAYAMCLSRDADDKVSEIAQNMTYIELSTNPGYMDNFVAACFLPHTNVSLFPSVSV